jgi:carboxyl-terminal processing protease
LRRQLQRLFGGRRFDVANNVAYIRASRCLRGEPEGDHSLARNIRTLLWRALCFGLVLWPLTLWTAESPHPANPTDFDQLLQQAQELEQAGHWSRAIDLYEQFSKQHPHNSPLLRERLRCCELHYSLSRRYHDPSFRAKLLTLPRAKVLALFDEVVRKIDDYYVDSPEHGRMFRGGIENLLLAVDDAEFRATNLPDASAEQLTELRDWLRRWRTAPVRSPAEARQYLASIASGAEQFIGLKAAPVALEFIYGACNELDDYSTYLTSDRLAELYAVIDGNFVGIGVELKSDERGLLVVNVLAGGPAAEGGIQAGDHIVAVGQVTTAGLATDEAANLLQGAPGTTVQLWIQSPSDSAPRRLVLKRRQVEVQSVSVADMASPSEGIGYVQLSGFQKSTLSELDRAVTSLQRHGMRSLILDLRGNPGGLLTSAVDISDKFLSDGVIVATRGRGNGQSQTYRADRSRPWAFPLVVLIDGDSASASEILAGAIQDHRRGTIVGTRSFGKGSVQSIFPLESADAGVRLTTAKFYSPRGRAYSHQGVSPDIEVARETAWRPSGSTIAQLNPAADAQLAAAIKACRQMLGLRAEN